MFRLISRKLRYWIDSKHRHPRVDDDHALYGIEGLKLSRNLEHNLSHIEQILGSGGDIKFHRFQFGADCRFAAALVYVDGLVNDLLITQAILTPLMSTDTTGIDKKSCCSELIDTVKTTILRSSDITRSDEFSALIEGCLSGNAVLLLEDSGAGLSISVKGWDKRGVVEPQTASVVRGPREGFTENLRSNTALIRRKIKSPSLRMDNMIIGEKTQTGISIMYIHGVANPKLIRTVKQRLENIDVDSVLESGYIEQYIEDSPYSIFPTVGHSEKPDVVAANILEGRVAIAVDGTPFVLTAPFLFMESFQTAEDYYVRPIYASTIRILRYIAFLLSVYAPAVFVALTTFHQELVPTTLLFTITQARAGTPFPAFIEAFVMVFAFEILREAGLRLPLPIGQAISIVGALIMGEAAVQAGLVGAPMVITIALTAVTGFVVPEQAEAASLLRIIMLVLSAAMGGFGMALGFLCALIHLASLKSFGIPYLSGIAPARAQYLQDMFTRAPLWAMTRRPDNLAYLDTTRRKNMMRHISGPRISEENQEIPEE